MGRWVSMALVASVWLAIGMVFGQEAGNLNYQKLVESADENEDGQVDRVEFTKQMTEAFFIVDTDKDGFLTVLELSKKVDKVETKNVEAADRDGDGKLSIHEYREAIDEDFDKADQDDDGKLTPEEIKSFVR